MAVVYNTYKYGHSSEKIGNETRVSQNHTEIKHQTVIVEPKSLRRSRSASISKVKSSLSVRQEIPHPILKIPSQSTLIQSVTSPSGPSQPTSVNDSHVSSDQLCLRTSIDLHGETLRQWDSYMFRRFRKILVSSCLSVRPSVRPSPFPHGTTRLSLDGFSWNLIFKNFLKICRGN